MFNLREELKLIIMREGTPMAKTLRNMKAEGYQISQPSNISKSIKRETIQFKHVKELLDYLGYKLTIERK